MAAITDLTSILDAFPAPSVARDRKEPGGILSTADKPAMDSAVAAALAGGEKVIQALVGMLREADPEADSKARHVIHAMVLRAGASDQERSRLAGMLASTIREDQPAEVRAFLLQQLQLIADKQVVPDIARWLTDARSSAPATAALVHIRDGAAEAIRGALARTDGRVRINLVQALGDLQDEKSAPAIAALLADSDVDTRTTAARALAHIGKADAADALLKAADSEGFERAAMTDACLTLASRLTASGSRADAREILVRLGATTPAEAYITRAVEKALEATR